MSDTCEKCGYCKACGRSNPVYHYYQPYQYPYWYYGQNGYYPTTVTTGVVSTGGGSTVTGNIPSAAQSWKISPDLIKAFTQK